MVRTRSRGRPALANARTKEDLNSRNAGYFRKHYNANKSTIQLSKIIARIARGGIPNSTTLLNENYKDVLTPEYINKVGAYVVL